MARPAPPPTVQAVTVERVADGIRVRAWIASGVARYWQPFEEDLLASEDAVTRWLSSLDIRHGPTAAVLAGAELKSDAALMEAIRRGMRRA